MDPTIYLSQLSDLELEVEYVVRGLVAITSDADEILRKSLAAEYLDESLKPLKTHVQDNPAIEIDICLTRYDELARATAALGITPSMDLVELALAKTIHYKDRIKRIINTFGDKGNISNVYSKFRRDCKCLLKLWQDGNTAKTDSVPRATIPLTAANNANRTSSPHTARNNIETDFYNSKLDDQSQGLINEGKELRGSVIDFFKQIDKNPNKRQLQGHIPHLSDLSFNDLEPEPAAHQRTRRTDPGNMYRENILQNVARPPPNEPVGSQFRMENCYQIKQRWNLSFDGTDNSNVHDFTYRLEQMARGDGFPIGALPKVLHMFLTKKAEDWYWIFKLDHPDVSWNNMKTAMLSYFSSYDFEEEIREQILRKYQNNKETFSDFALGIQKLNARLTNRLSERELIYRLCQNMLPALRNVTLPAQNLIQTVEELRVLCQRYERMWEQTGYDPRRFSDNQHRRRQVTELCHELQNTHIRSTSDDSKSTNRGSYDKMEGAVPIYTAPHEVEAIHSLSNHKKPNEQPGQLVCWNCKDLGHRYQDCETEFLNIFCFGCGRANVRKPNCQNCIRFTTGNYRPGGITPRTNHSERNMSPPHQQKPQQFPNSTSNNQ